MGVLYHFFAQSTGLICRNLIAVSVVHTKWQPLILVLKSGFRPAHIGRCHIAGSMSPTSRLLLNSPPSRIPVKPPSPTTAIRTVPCPDVLPLYLSPSKHFPVNMSTGEDVLSQLLYLKNQHSPQCLLSQGLASRGRRLVTGVLASPYAQLDSKHFYNIYTIFGQRLPTLHNCYTNVSASWLGLCECLHFTLKHFCID